jgi:hypothetical protein
MKENLQHVEIATDAQEIIFLAQLARNLKMVSTNFLL